MNTPDRHYPIHDLDFTDFWDICGYFMRAHPRLSYVEYWIDTEDGPLVEKEADVAMILKSLNHAETPITRYIARLRERNQSDGETAEITYLTEAIKEQEFGLYFSAGDLPKRQRYEFEDFLNEKFNLEETLEPKIQFGIPCEILAAVIDLRGFSIFCEKPNVESPYACALIHSFYQIVRRSLHKYPPETIKFQGDGVLTIWETTADDREVAIQTCLQGAMELNSLWQVMRKSAQFSHGTPEDVAIGISFGLASVLPGIKDYIGRPINVASRLCSVCPGGEIFVDKSLPGIPPEIAKAEASCFIKSFGRYYLWRIRAS